MPDFKIEKGVPFNRSPRSFKYPFGQMDVGDSFSINGTPVEAVRSSASWFGRRNGREFSIRRTDDGYRCWRTA